MDEFELNHETELLGQIIYNTKLCETHLSILTLDDIQDWNELNKPIITAMIKLYENQEEITFVNILKYAPDYSIEYLLELMEIQHKKNERT